MGDMLVVEWVVWMVAMMVGVKDGWRADESVDRKVFLWVEMMVDA